MSTKNAFNFFYEGNIEENVYASTDFDLASQNQDEDCYDDVSNTNATNITANGY